MSSLAMVSKGHQYDSNAAAAIRRRKEGLCGYCGHPQHQRLLGCECGCPVLFETEDETVIAKMTDMFEVKS